MKKEYPHVEWCDPIEKEIFFQRGLTSFNSFWQIEESGANIEYKIVSNCTDKKNTCCGRQTTCIKFEQNIKYFLKKYQGRGYKCAQSEFKNYPLVEQFGFKTAKLVAYSFDDKNKFAFLLTKNIAASICLNDIVNGTILPEIMAKYKTCEKETLARLATNIMKYHRAGYFYPDLKAKHVFVNPNNSDIYIVDIERFCHKSKLPFLYRLPFLGKFIQSQERQRFLNTISPLKSTVKELRKLFKNG